MALAMEHCQTTYPEVETLKISAIRRLHLVPSPPTTLPSKPLANGHVTIKSSPKTIAKELYMLGKRTFQPRTFSKSKRRCLWRDPEKSIGTSCISLGAIKCWECKGPAGDLARELLPKVMEHLDSRHEDLNEGESLPCMLMFGLYMVGQSEAKANPALIISGDRKPRKKALKLIRESKLLVSLPYVLLADSEIPPLSRAKPEQLSSKDAAQSSVIERVSKKVFCDSKTENTCGIQVYIQWPNTDGTICQRNATVGCILRWQGKYLGWTVAHAFSEIPESKAAVASNGDVDYAFDEDYEESLDGLDVDSSAVTSTESASSRSSPLPQPEQHQPPTVNDPEELVNELAIQPEEFGSLFKSSVDHDPSSLDWALIEVTQSKFMKTTTLLLGDEPHQEAISPLQVAGSSPVQADIIAVTGSRGVLRGTLSPMSTYMKLPPSTKFQEVWTVRLEGKLAKGDCGSLVVDCGGKIYGHIVAGDLQNGLGYMIPAFQTFQDMKRQVGNDLVFSPPNEEVAEVSSDLSTSQENEVEIILEPQAGPVEVESVTSPVVVNGPAEVGSSRLQRWARSLSYRARQVRGKFWEGSSFGHQRSSGERVRPKLIGLGVHEIFRKPTLESIDRQKVSRKEVPLAAGFGLYSFCRPDMSARHPDIKEPINTPVSVATGVSVV